MSSNTQLKGQSLAEYALILALIAIFSIGALSSLGSSLQGGFGSLASAIGGVMGGGGGASGGSTYAPVTSLPEPPTVIEPSPMAPPDIGGSPDTSCVSCNSGDLPNQGDIALQ